MKLRTIVLFLIATLFNVSNVFAQDPVRVSHHIVSINEVGNTIQLQIELTVTNLGDNDLYNMMLVPEGIEFSGNDHHKNADFSYLPINGAITKTWITRSYLAPQYFAHETPLLFLIEATLQNGDAVRIPVISEDGEA